MSTPLTPPTSGPTIAVMVPDDAPDTRDVSYDELAAARGIGRDSAVRLAQRRRWYRFRMNDGTARVRVPIAELSPDDRRADGRGDDAPDDGVNVRGDDAGDVALVVVGDDAPDNSREIKALEAAVATLGEAVAAAERRSEAAEAQAARAQTTAESLGRALEVEQRERAADAAAARDREAELRARLTQATRPRSLWERVRGR